MTNDRTFEARREEITEWLRPGLELAVEPPTGERLTFRATMSEFGFIGEGKTFHEAYDAVTEMFGQYIMDIVRRGARLPDRGRWLAEHAKPANSRDG